MIVLFWYWFVSQHIMSSTCIHFVTKGRISVFIAELHFIVCICTYHNFFIQSSFDGHQACLSYCELSRCRHGSTNNSSRMLLWFCFGTFPGVWWLNHIVCLFSDGWGIFKRSFIIVVRIHVPTNLLSAFSPHLPPFQFASLWFPFLALSSVWNFQDYVEEQWWE